RCRVQRQERAEGARAGPQALQERGAHVAVREAALGALLVVHSREELRLGERLAEGKEVVDERNPPTLQHGGRAYTEIAGGPPSAPIWDGLRHPLGSPGDEGGCR